MWIKFRHLRQCFGEYTNIVWFAGQIDRSATSICVKIIVSWEAHARYSISTKSGDEICLKDIVSDDAFLIGTRLESAGIAGPVR